MKRVQVDMKTLVLNNIFWRHIYTPAWSIHGLQRCNERTRRQDIQTPDPCSAISAKSDTRYHNQRAAHSASEDASLDLLFFFFFFSLRSAASSTSTSASVSRFRLLFSFFSFFLFFSSKSTGATSSG